MGKTFKDFKKDGKVTLDGPKVKDRKPFAPATQKHKSKKGKGSYERKNAFDEDEQGYMVKTVIRKSKKNPSMFVAIAGGDVVGKGRNKQELINIVSSTIPKLFPNGKVQFIDKTDDDYESLSKSRSVDPYDPGFEEDEEKKACWKGYKKKGMKKKGDKMVNNCVKESVSILKFIEALMTENHAEAHKHLKDAINRKIQQRISKEIEKPLF